MLRWPPEEGRRAALHTKYLLAFVLLVLPWLPLGAGQQQQQQHQQQQRQDTARSIPTASIQRHPGLPPDTHDTLHPPPAGKREAAAVPHVEPATENWASTLDSKVLVETPSVVPHPPTPNPSWKSARVRRDDDGREVKDTRNPNPILAPPDARALATLAPAQTVRAPPPSRLQPAVAASEAGRGLSSLLDARSLGDWEVEDFVLLATVDGDLYASDRTTGKTRWHLRFREPMVETQHYRTNTSATTDRHHTTIDRYIWAVEPIRGGNVYAWLAGDPSPRLERMPFSMRSLIDETPHATANPPVIYTAQKSTSMITLDAATGRVLKVFGSKGSHVNTDESCVRSPSGLATDGVEDDATECSSGGSTITLGKTEYIVGIQHHDGRDIAQLRYSEWGPNLRDNDLISNYNETMDGRYVVSGHDGKIYGLDVTRARLGDRAYSFTGKYTSPVAMVFDICRPWNAPRDSSPELIVLPQPLGSRLPPEERGRMDRPHVFINQTDGGSWYALSRDSFPMIDQAKPAKAAQAEWWETQPSVQVLDQAEIDKALIGAHFLNGTHYRQHVPALPETPSNYHEPKDPDNDNYSTVTSQPTNAPPDPNPPPFVHKVKTLPVVAANSIRDLLSNPALAVIFFAALIYYQKDLRRWYKRKTTSTMRKIGLYLEQEADDTSDETERVVVEESPATEHSDLNKVDEAKAIGADPLANSVGNLGSDDEQKSGPQENGQNEAAEEALSKGDAIAGEVAPNGEPPKKKAHRGRRGGVKHKKGKNKREGSQSRDDEDKDGDVEAAVNQAKQLGQSPKLEPDTLTVTNDMQAVTGSIIKMGNIEVDTDVQLGSGSNGTLVFAGKYDGRDVAVKRMLIQFYDIASQETKLLRESDDHPNVIRYYAQQVRDGFLYIALERCAASLADVVERPHSYAELATAGKRDLPGVLYQITNGLDHLHSLRIVHRDLKPQNILVSMSKDGRPRLLVSDFGLCKKLEGGQSSFGATTGRAAGTSGWRAPELLLDDDARDTGPTSTQSATIGESTHSGGSGSLLVSADVMPNRRATRAIDIFSLGLVFFYVLTNGSHPFDCGDRYMREVNIRKGTYNLKPLDSLGDFAYEAKDLISMMLSANPKRRPSAREVMAHPFFWSARKRLAFLCDVSDHFEKEPRDPPSAELQELERHAPEVTRGDFLRVLPKDFVDSLGKQRKYTGSRMLDLLRALRNKRNHYEDMPEGLKRQVGPLPDGYLAFWTVKFPNLLLACWNVVYNVQWETTDRFREYYEPAGL